MTDKEHDLIDQPFQDLNNDGIDRRGFLKCMAWAGTGLLWTLHGGIPTAQAFSSDTARAAKKGGDFSFVQISDSHMGFNKSANPDVVATLQAAIDKINGLAAPPDFLLHTGDISHLSKPEQFDTVDQALRGASAKDVFFVPGEHDVLDDNGKSYLERYGKNTQGAGWYSFEKKGVHFMGPGECDEPEVRWTGVAWWRAAGVDRKRCQASFLQHTHRGVRAHPVVVRLSGMGLGYGR